MHLSFWNFHYCNTTAGFIAIGNDKISDVYGKKLYLYESCPFFSSKKGHPDGVALSDVTRLHFPFGENCGVAPVSRRQRRSSAPHFYVRVPPLFNSKKGHPDGVALFGASDVTRTRDLLITSEMHYRLCYTSKLARLLYMEPGQMSTVISLRPSRPLLGSLPGWTAGHRRFRAVWTHPAAVRRGGRWRSSRYRPSLPRCRAGG